VEAGGKWRIVECAGILTMKKTQYNQILTICAFIMLSSVSAYAQNKPWQGVGRAATPAEIKAWDIDVRGDFKGLPKGSGSVSKGEQVWEAKCASCHGTFGESNEVFTPLVGGTTLDDMKTGRTASLAKGDVAQRTTLMKLSKVSTLWDYINRAMPWTAPKTLTTEEVYAVTAYILNLGGVVDGNFTLSDQNIAQVQDKLPNRNGMVLTEDLWNTAGKGDVKNVACMNNCETDPKVNSFLPDFARNAHGNIAEQNRGVGPAIGIDSTKPAPTTLQPKPAVKAPVVEEVKVAEVKTTSVAETKAAPSSAPVVAAATAATTAAAKPAATPPPTKTAAATPKAEVPTKPAPAAAPSPVDVSALLKANSCTACHGMKNKIVGPGFNEIAAKYKGKNGSENYLTGKIKNGGSGVWGPMPMPAQAQMKDADAKAIAQWLAAGAK
jgi:S-disulfanyl-L-cysteine oxidoreductase SoxD